MAAVVRRGGQCRRHRTGAGLSTSPNPSVGAPAEACPLCAGPGGDVVHAGTRLRVVLPDEPAWPGFVRVIWNAHAAELTDLSEAESLELLDAIRRAERVLRDVLAPDKVNVAALGNMVPHLHVHLVPRWRDDATFPASIWTPPSTGTDPVGDARRAEAASARRAAVARRVPALRAALAAAFGVADGSAGDAEPAEAVDSLSGATGLSSS